MKVLMTWSVLVCINAYLVRFDMALHTFVYYISIRGRLEKLLSTEWTPWNYVVIGQKAFNFRGDDFNNTALYIL